MSGPESTPEPMQTSHPPIWEVGNAMHIRGTILAKIGGLLEEAGFDTSTLSFSPAVSNGKEVYREITCMPYISANAKQLYRRCLKFTDPMAEEIIDGIRTYLANNEKSFQQNHHTNEVIDNSRLPSERSNHLLVLPNPEMRVREGGGSGVLERGDFEERLEPVLQILNKNGIKITNKIEEKLPPHMMRRNPYYCLWIAHFNKSILVCNEKHQAIFVVIGRHTPTTKDDLQERGAAVIKFNSSLLEQDLVSALKHEGPVVKLNNEYFTLENIRADLQTYAHAGGLSDIKSLTSNIGKIRATCQSGKVLAFSSYLRNAAAVFGFTDSVSPVEKRFFKVTLDKLKEIIGIKTIFMDEEYFLNSTIVLSDLTYMAEANGYDSLTELTTTAARFPKSAICCNGEELTLDTYLRHAGKILGLQKSAKIVLNKLKSIVGFVIRDKFYFESPSLVLFDLNAMVKESKGEIESVQSINARNARIVNIVCANGERVSGKSYFEKVRKECGFSSAPEALAYLKSVAISDPSS